MLKSITNSPIDRNDYPFNVETIKSLDRLKLDPKITFFTGENGSGKSSLIEAIACGLELPTIGSNNVNSEPSLKHARALADTLKFAFDYKSRNGFFLRAEDFINFLRNVMLIN
jgi:predicted ATPase